MLHLLLGVPELFMVKASQLVLVLFFVFYIQNHLSTMLRHHFSPGLKEVEPFKVVFLSDTEECYITTKAFYLHC